MIQIASSQLGCSTGNVTCYCNEPDFGYGVRDCSNEACPNASDANEVIAYGLTYCREALSSYSATASATVSGSAASVLSSAVGGTVPATTMATTTPAANNTATIVNTVNTVT